MTIDREKDLMLAINSLIITVEVLYEVVKKNTIVDPEHSAELKSYLNQMKEYALPPIEGVH